MSDCADTARLGPDERFREAASILAAGVLRLRHRAALPAENTPENPAKLSPEGLEVPDETVLSVHVGQRHPRPEEGAKISTRVVPGVEGDRAQHPAARAPASSA